MMKLFSTTAAMLLAFAASSALADTTYDLCATHYDKGADGKNQVQMEGPPMCILSEDVYNWKPEYRTQRYGGSGFIDENIEDFVPSSYKRYLSGNSGPFFLISIAGDGTEFCLGSGGGTSGAKMVPVGSLCWILNFNPVTNP